MKKIIIIILLIFSGLNLYASKKKISTKNLFKKAKVEYIEKTNNYDKYYLDEGKLILKEKHKFKNKKQRRKI